MKDAWGHCGRASQQRLEVDADEVVEEHRRRTEDEVESVIGRKMNDAYKADGWLAT